MTLFKPLAHPNRIPKLLEAVQQAEKAATTDRMVAAFVAEQMGGVDAEIKRFDRSARDVARTQGSPVHVDRAQNTATATTAAAALLGSGVMETGLGMGVAAIAGAGLGVHQLLGEWAKRHNLDAEATERVRKYFEEMSNAYSDAAIDLVQTLGKSGRNAHDARDAVAKQVIHYAPTFAEALTGKSVAGLTSIDAPIIYGAVPLVLNKIGVLPMSDELRTRLIRAEVQRQMAAGQEPGQGLVGGGHDGVISFDELHEALKPLPLIAAEQQAADAAALDEWYEAAQVMPIARTNSQVAGPALSL